eukprot:m.224026 g.224026  ORF g.224026 m.224026 type:complete len:250 (+) comp11023_c0_seq1:22-771(+)
MSSVGAGYDLSATTFSPAGRIFQVEYAGKAVENSGTVVGLRCKDGVVFASENIIISKLHEENTVKHIFTVDGQLGVAIAGLISDGRMLIERARAEAHKYKELYGNTIPPKMLNERMSSFMHQFSLYGGTRPCGACVLISGFSAANGPELYAIEPSGVSWGYYGYAAGKAKQNAQAELEKLKPAELTTEQAIKEVARIIYSVHDELKDKDFELELSWVSAATNGKHQPVPKDVFEGAVQFAKAAMEEGDD